MSPLRIGIVLSTIREGRFGSTPAAWIAKHVSSHNALSAEIVDLREYPLPFFGDPEPIARAGPVDEITRRWMRKMDEFDGYIFITAEYNHSITGPLKNALDYLGPQLHRKPAAFVGYGGVGGARAVEHLRQVLVEFQMVPLRHAVHIGMEPLVGVRQHQRSLEGYDFLEASAAALIEELGWWASALRAARFPVEADADAPERALA